MTESTNLDEVINLAKKLSDLRKQKSDLEDQAKDLGKEAKSVERELFSIMERNNLNGLRVEGVGNVYPTQQKFAKLLDQHELFEFLRANDMGDVIKESVHNGTLRSLNNEWNEKKGCSLPGVEQTFKDIISIRKG